MQNKNRTVTCLVLLSLLFCGSSCDAIRSTNREQPNIVVILVDDMDLGLMQYMPQTDSLIAQQGVTFTNYFATSPICCPSRASMLRGQYAHNTDILENFPGFKRFFQRGEEAETLAVWLNREGYNTALIGKYLNLYPNSAGRLHVPAGWTDWRAFLFQDSEDGGDFFYNYTLNENGELVQYGAAEDDYSTDVIGERSLEFIDQSVANDSPFFILVSVYAPHGPSIPALRHSELFADLKYPQGPSFNEEDISDKPAIVRALATSGDDFDAGDANRLYQERVRSLQAVDELVEQVIQRLEQNGELDNTYIFFLSDNGFHLGEHSLPSGKGTPYEEDIHVPLMIRGPGIQPNTQITQIVANIDIAPTIAEMAAAHAADFVDGRSIVPLLSEPTLGWRQGLLIEIGYIEEAQVSSGPQNISMADPRSQTQVIEYPDSKFDDYFSETDGGAFRGIRTETFVYVEYANGEIEYYDLRADPYQLDNLAQGMDASILSALHSWLEQLKTCAAEDCRNLESAPPDALSNPAQ